MYCVMYWLYSLLFACAAAYFHPSIAQPLELVDFEMLDTRENIENNRYDIAATQGTHKMQLFQLNCYTENSKNTKIEK